MDQSVGFLRRLGAVLLDSTDCISAYWADRVCSVSDGSEQLDI